VIDYVGWYNESLGHYHTRHCLSTRQRRQEI